MSWPAAGGRSAAQRPPLAPEPTPDVPRPVVLAGNPNSGKTTVYNALSGARGKVGNYPGVTVARRSAVLPLDEGTRIELVDLPGTYSLSARSREEEVAAEAVLGRFGAPPAAVVAIVDATALARGLYLVSQLAETGLPLVVGLNMMDEAEAAGLDIDHRRLGERLGARCVPLAASHGRGLSELRDAITEALTDAPRPEPRVLDLGPELEPCIARVESAVASWVDPPTPATRRAWALWALLSLGDDELEDVPPAVREAVDEARAQAEREGRQLEYEIVHARYAEIDAHLGEVLARAEGREEKPTVTDRIDAILLHPLSGALVFVSVMAVVFQSLFAWADPAIGLIESAVAALQGVVSNVVPPGPFASLLSDGVIAGVGNVVVFVPQIALLFFLIGILEDSGYLARVAFLLDRVMGGIGLHGKAFVPMLSGFACAVPAVMATRTIESRRDRLLTMMVIPLTSCSARLPVYVLVIAVVFAPALGGLVLLSMYMLSVLAALGAAFVLRRTVLKGPKPPLVLELPPYRRPVLRNLLRHTWERVKTFLVDAGTVILALTIILWALLSFPKDDQVEARFDRVAQEVTRTVESPGEREARLAEIAGQRARAQLTHSVAGRIGKAMEPALEPLGLDWRMGVGILGAFAAREVFVSTLGVVFGIEDATEDSPSLRSSLDKATWPDGDPLMTPLAGVSLMVFFVLACQCMSTLAVVRKESGSWRWPIFLFVYMTALAYAASLVVYQVGSWLGWGTA